MKKSLTGSNYRLIQRDCIIKNKYLQGDFQMEYKVLSNGVKMPQLGYGVYQVAKEECERCVLDALNVG